jgi:hypothetical protein
LSGVVQQHTFAMSPPVGETTNRAKKVACGYTWKNVYEGVADAEVVLHVYHLTTSRLVKGANAVLRKMGTGFFHVGIEVHGWEWSFGWNQGGSGIYSCPPGSCCQHSYRGPVVLGKTRLTSHRVAAMLSDMSKEWLGLEYSVLGRNCCSFSEEFCQRLGVGQLPLWVRSLAAGGGRLRSLAVGNRGASDGRRMQRTTKLLRLLQLSTTPKEICAEEKEARESLMGSSSGSSSSCGSGSCRSGIGLKRNLTRSLSCSTLSTVGSLGLISLNSAQVNTWRQIGAASCCAPLKE